MRLVLTARETVATDTVRLAFADPSSVDLPPFAPGAHVELSFGDMVRRYSLISSPENLGSYVVCVLRTDPGAGGSAWLHDRLALGDTVEVSTPRDAFPLIRDASRSVFIAGGIGITPFLTMMAKLQADGADWELHYAARDEARMLSVSLPQGRISRYLDAEGRPGLDVAALLDGLDRAAHLYVCGPRPLIEAVRTGAAARGWPKDAIHFESFGPSPKPGDKPIRIRLAQSDVDLVVEPGTTILDALLANGVWAPFECRRGECGSCHTPVVSGEPDHRDVSLTPEQRRAGLCTCVSWAVTPDLVLDL